MSPAFLERVLRRAFDCSTLRLIAVHPTAGGCIHSAARVETSEGDAFVKWNARVARDLFTAEAKGLSELEAAASGLVVPKVLLAGSPDGDTPGFLVLEYLRTAPRGAAIDEALGRGLAAVHRRAAGSFGFTVPTYCGPTPQDNTASASWVEFYRDRRLRFVLGLLASERGLSSAERGIFERLFDRLPQLLPHAATPALIHGDLWSGNVMASANGPAVFDPACSYADREMEFGITLLFGGFSAVFFDAYKEAWPLPPGWEERHPIYRLYHLLNHHLIFGGHYLGEALAVARRYVG